MAGIPSVTHPGPGPGPGLFNDDEARWRAVRTRDAAADGCFVYAVETTKVYCRPICKARLARRSNVRFYTGGSEALEAGFRACKRCKPEMEGLMPVDRAVERIRQFVVEHAAAAGQAGEASLSLSQMARKSGLSKWHFHRVFKRTLGVTPFEYLRNQRIAWQGSPVSWKDLAAGVGLDDTWTTALDTDGPSESPDGRSLALSPSEPEWDDLLLWPEDTDLVTGWP
ncbi:Metal binding domain of Ada family protein [Metarhizium album ARSEF 1941]|uniref:Metal binding domain of Ada family protein n=1 Tax=Metarhizium album (strain ARSEF 1941) TaxID=1081103 RepID=A0A0B2WM14_METAS|nr:Metal binding domain of Ada family protein [Metarhizium album ARSEF 1941]KHN94532.1 Metal binding domain of Ada family protein [Metarhizium album ARSEF 1941]